MKRPYRLLVYNAGAPVGRKQSFATAARRDAVADEHRTAGYQVLTWEAGVPVEDSDPGISVLDVAACAFESPFNQRELEGLIAISAEELGWLCDKIQWYGVELWNKIADHHERHGGDASNSRELAKLYSERYRLFKGMEAKAELQESRHQAEREADRA